MTRAWDSVVVLLTLEAGDNLWRRRLGSGRLVAGDHDEGMNDALETGARREELLGAKTIVKQGELVKHAHAGGDLPQYESEAVWRCGRRFNRGIDDNCFERKILAQFAFKLSCCGLSSDKLMRALTLSEIVVLYRRLTLCF